jgi:hypothetical protein
MSFGLSSYGYDIRVADEFKVFHPAIRARPQRFQRGCRRAARRRGPDRAVLSTSLTPEDWRSSRNRRCSSILRRSWRRQITRRPRAPGGGGWSTAPAASAAAGQTAAAAALAATPAATTPAPRRPARRQPRRRAPAGDPLIRPARHALGDALHILGQVWPTWS